MGELLHTVSLDGKLYDVDTDFRTAIECEKIMNSSDISDYDREIMIVTKLFGHDAPYNEESRQKARFFLQGGVIDDRPESNVRIIDTEQHWALIYSAFMQCHKIDLHKNDLHYQEYLFLLQGVKDTILNDMMEVMQMKLSDEKDPKRRAELKKAQDYFRIKEKNIVKQTLEEHPFMKKLK